jgi:hypothetical protein
MFILKQDLFNNMEKLMKLTIDLNLDMIINIDDFSINSDR